MIKTVFPYQILIFILTIISTITQQEMTHKYESEVKAIILLPCNPCS